MTKSNLFIPLLILTCFAACKKDVVDCTEPAGEQEVVPACIQSIIDSAEVNNDLLAVKTQVIDTEDHYWLHTGANWADGDEFIVNATCDTVCVLAGWFPNECQAAYTDSLWQTVWEM
jgi:hypothetical protein